MNNPPEDISFKATIPSNQTAIQVHGGGGARVTLEIPESEIGNYIRIVQMRDNVLQVSIKCLPHETFGTGKSPKKTPWLKPTG